MKLFVTVVSIAAAWCVAHSALAQSPSEPANGTIKGDSASVLAFSSSSAQWLGIEEFWLEYAGSGPGKYWGRGSDYPPYAEVSEHDTFMVEVESGPCLMYFFHQRWRRAQDVRRWDERFNEQLGCPRVFE